MSRRRTIAAFVLASLAAGGCNADYAGLEVTADGRIRPGTTVEREPFVIPVGHVARIHARPRSSSSETFEDPDNLMLRSRDPEILRVYGDEEQWRWALVGRAFGSTCVEVVVGDRVEECIEAQVTPSP